MRPHRFGPLPALLLAACAASPAPTPSVASPSPTGHAAGITPANIRRVGRELPPGYEVSNIARAASPRAIWGLGEQPAANPPECGALADPAAGREQPAQGISGSGPGGIVDAVVVAAPAALSRDIVAGCTHWDLTAGRTVVSVGLIDAPQVDGAQTLGMVADIRAAVESGSEIDSRAYTFVAYLGDYYAFTTLTTDPGSILPPLPPQFAADLLVKTVSTLRG
ncbi:DUF5642 family protein [Mycobacterium sp. Z3061]|uniref:DUF5642 family protein n=1 Tax=Mycobacterium sp. Z3061 TaxID=3073562 RepID=UPI002872D744|nr:DUF5642 family protein [Mycobacterium sp. Z3061]